MAQKDILIFMSDQHSGGCIGYAGDPLVRTPRLDELARNGTAFTNAYTSCPMCVPARSSFMTGKMPERSGIFSNDDCINPCEPTMAHAMQAAGYETVLIGRMHFMGEDQHHGFLKRLVGDFSPTFWGRGGTNRNDLGKLNGTQGEKHCLDVVGKAEDQPVLEYDRAVIEATLKYLSEPHNKPQFIVVGTYAPHFTYMAYPELFDYYRERMGFPITRRYRVDHNHTVLKHKEQHPDDETLLNARSAYYGMVENLDRQIGGVYDAYREFLRRNRREGVFCYVSDHGDMLGEHNLFGKRCFYEGSVKIPLVFAGAGIQKGIRNSSLVSICDISATVCDLGGASPLPGNDGVSIRAILEGTAGQARDFVSCGYVVESYPGKGAIPCRMVRKNDYKLITFCGFDEDDQLFDVVSDPSELKNLAKELPEIAKEMKDLVSRDWNPEEVARVFEIRTAGHKILKTCGKNPEIGEAYRFRLQGKY